MATAAAARHHHPALVERRRLRGGGIRCSSPVFRRRLVVGATTAAAAAVGANFGGVTSFLLGLSPELGRSLRLDVLYPVGGFTRCLDSDNGFEAMKAKYDKYWDKSSIALAVACFLDPRYKKNLVEYFAGRIYHERAAHEVNRFIDIVNKLF